MAGDFDELLEHAAALCEEGHFDEARDVLRRVLARDRASGQAWMLLARAELGAGNNQQAFEASERACTFVPGSKDAHLLACVAVLRLGRSKEALGHVREAVRIDPFDWRALALLAQLLAGDGASMREARELTARVVKLAPVEAEAHVTAGVVAAGAGDRDAARASFRRALELDPASSVVQHELARMRLGRRVNDPAALAEAAAGFERALVAEPDAERSRNTLELVLRMFLSKGAYLLLIDAYVVGRVTASSSSGAARLLPALLLLIPAFYARRFYARLTPPLVGRLRGSLLASGRYDSLWGVRRSLWSASWPPRPHLSRCGRGSRAAPPCSPW